MQTENLKLGKASSQGSHLWFLPEIRVRRSQRSILDEGAINYQFFRVFEEMTSRMLTSGFLHKKPKK
jgi:hypothetical protein